MVAAQLMQRVAARCSDSAAPVFLEKHPVYCDSSFA